MPERSRVLEIPKSISLAINLIHRSIMSNILRFQDFSNSDIRVTEDGRFSVFDVIKFCGKKNPSQVWNGDSRENGLIHKFSELIHKVENTSFGGKGGAAKLTPVATRVNILYIIGLLPGAIGRSYREDAAKVFSQYLDASPELAESVIDRATPEDLKRIATRLKSKQIRLDFTSTLQEHGVTQGWQFAACTNEIYVGILGNTAEGLKRERGLSKRDKLRDELDNFELSQVMFSEALVERNIKAKDLNGYIPCKDESRKSADKVKRISTED